MHINGICRHTHEQRQLFVLITIINNGKEYFASCTFKASLCFSQGEADQLYPPANSSSAAFTVATEWHFVLLEWVR